MPLYFFDIYNDQTTEDDNGIDLADSEAALKRARAEAQNLAAESIREHGHLILDHRIVVRDGNAQRIARQMKLHGSGDSTPAGASNTSFRTASGFCNAN